MGSFSPTSAYVPCLSVAALAGASGSLALLSSPVAAIDFIVSRPVPQAKPGGLKRYYRKLWIGGLSPDTAR